MGLFGNLAVPPSVENLALLKYLIVLLYLIHIPFISMLMGSTLFSVLFNLSDKSKRNPTHLRFAQDLIHTFAQRKGVGLALGVLPLVTLGAIYVQILQGADLLLVNILSSVILLAAAGFILIYVYQSSFDLRHRNFLLHIGSGVFGTLLLMGAYLVFTSGTSLIMDPEKWSTVRSPMNVIFSWNVVARYVHFMFMALAITGAGMLFFLLRWRRAEMEDDPDYRGFVKQFGAGVALTCLLVQPLFVLWGLTSLPRLALSIQALAASAAVLLLLLILSLLLVRVLREAEPSVVSHVFVLAMVLLLAIFISESASRESAIQEHTHMLVTQAEEIEQERILARGGDAGAADAKRGEDVFKKRCMTCHRFDKRLVGPSLMSVLPKYVDKADALVAFIRNPSKIDPEYPAMPNLGLKEIDIESVTTYVLSQMESQPE